MNLSIPKHIAIIMDGNGRWAERRGKQRVYGHVRGSSRIKAIVEECIRLGVKALTLYTFSIENWQRPEAEKQVLWNLLRKYLSQYKEELNKQNVKLQVIGEIHLLSSDLQEALQDSIQKLKNNTGLVLTFAISYSSRREITKVTQLLAQECVQGLRNPEEITEEVFNDRLWTSYLKEFNQVDLMIRTSGEYRISNFLLWQVAYAEFVFLDICWPDFLSEHLNQAIEEYSKRERRFGQVVSSVTSSSEALTKNIVSKKLLKSTNRVNF